MRRVDSLGLGLPVAWGNVDFKPPSNGRYLAATFIPNGNSRVAITTGAPHQYRGLLQVSVYWKRDEGTAAPVEVAGQVAEHFPR